jgi:hypothetical protein
MNTHIIHIDPDTDIVHGITVAAEKVAADVPEENARKLVAHLAKIIYMKDYIIKSGHGTPNDIRELHIFRECLAYAELPHIALYLSPKK